jgi:hypothetical protein
MTETIEEQRRVEGFGDPQYTCGETELAIRLAIYTFLQQKKAAGELEDLTMSQDWSGNTLHLKGSIRPMDLARAVVEAVAKSAEVQANQA